MWLACTNGACDCVKVCIVSSAGGHLTEVRCLADAYARFDHFYVLNHQALLADEMRGRTYFISHSERDWRFFLNLCEAFRILLRERPRVILSTGAGPIVPFAIMGKALFGAKVIFVETLTRITKPSLTARIMYYLADDFFYQWKALASYFPKGRFGGPLV